MCRDRMSYVDSIEAGRIFSCSIGSWQTSGTSTIIQGRCRDFKRRGRENNPKESKTEFWCQAGRSRVETRGQGCPEDRAHVRHAYLCVGEWEGCCEETVIPVPCVTTKRVSVPFYGPHPQEFVTPHASQGAGKCMIARPNQYWGYAKDQAGYAEAYPPNGRMVRGVTAAVGATILENISLALTTVNLKTRLQMLQHGHAVLDLYPLIYHPA